MLGSVKPDQGKVHELSVYIGHRWYDISGLGLLFLCIVPRCRGRSRYLPTTVDDSTDRVLQGVRGGAVGVE